MHLYKTGRGARYRSLILSVAAFAAIVLVAVLALNQTEQKSTAEETQALKDALRRASSACYAVEGQYPPSLKYLQDQYGIVIDTQRFHVTYEVFAQNIMPDIAVRQVGGE